jgi:membrane-bound lytic murein transglycosylase A
MLYRYSILLWCLFLLCLGCAAPVEKPLPPLVPVSPGDYPSFRDDLNRKSLEQAAQRSLEYFNRLPEIRVYKVGKADYSVAELKESLSALLELLRSADSDEIFRRRIGETFDVYKSVGSDDEGRVLFTGYYAPVLEGSREETQVYRFPVYRTPDDHIVVDLGVFSEKYQGERIIARYENGQILPYYTREAIDTDHCLRGRGLEIAWLADPVDLFFLHIQGSGLVKLGDGTVMQISYAQANGHPYRSVGRLLIDNGKIASEDMSLRSIKRYLREHPEEMRDILNHNESYVFFRIVDEGPVGSLNVPVTAGRTIATDSSLFPKGVLAFIRTRKPVIADDGTIESWEPFSRFVFNQDTGGAITGPGRVDIYCGEGDVAGIMAGHMKEVGELYFLVKKRK